MKFLKKIFHISLGIGSVNLERLLYFVAFGAARHVTESRVYQWFRLSVMQAKYLAPGARDL